MVEQVAGALFQKFEVLLGVFLRQRCARGDLRAAAVHLKRTDSCDQNGDVRGQAGQTGLDVPELLKADVGSEAGLGDMVIEQLEGQTVSNNGGLADGNVGERAGMNENRLMLDRVAHGGVDGVAHPRGHRACNLEIVTGDGFAAAGVRSRATARIAINSEPTAMPNLDSIMKPSRRPPMPMMMLRRPCAQKSMTQPISTRFGSMSRRLRPFLASHSSLLLRSERPSPGCARS